MINNACPWCHGRLWHPRRYCSACGRQLPLLEVDVHKTIPTVRGWWLVVLSVIFASVLVRVYVWLQLTSPLLTGQAVVVTGTPRRVPTPTAAELRGSAVPSPIIYGGSIAYIARRADHRGDELRVATRALDASQIITSGVALSEPAWSPDGHHIAVVVGQGSARDIYSVNNDGSDPHNLTIDYPVSGETQPTWAPDGRRLAFTTDHIGVATIAIVDIYKGPQWELKSGPDVLNRDPVWLAPDQLLFVSQCAGLWLISMIDVSNGTIETLFASREELGDLALAPDKRRIAFARRTRQSWNLYTLALDRELPIQTTAQPLAVAAADERHPTWISNTDVVYDVVDRQHQLYRANAQMFDQQAARLSFLIIGGAQPAWIAAFTTPAAPSGALPIRSQPR